MKLSSTISPTLFSRGFTLVELMAAMTVLAILGVIVTQMLSSTNDAIRASSSQIDAVSQVRIAFARMDQDITQMLRRKDVDFFCSNPAAGATNPNVLQFYSSVTSQDRAGATGANRGISLISYRVAPHADLGNKLCLQRAAVAVHYGDDFMGLDDNGAPVAFGAGTVPDIAASDYDVIAEGVFRIWVSYLLNPQAADGADLISVGEIRSTTNTNINIRTAPSLRIAPPVRQIGTSTTNYVNFSAISSLVIGLAATDAETRTLLTAANLDSMANALPDIADDQLPLAVWNPVMSDFSNFSGIPLPALQSMRAYQRAFNITPAWKGIRP